jgi:hypothetical protein
MPQRKEVNPMEKIFRSRTKVEEKEDSRKGIALMNKNICPWCLKSHGEFTPLSLLVFWHIYSVLKKKKARDRILLINTVSAIGPAKRWVKEVLDKAIMEGWVLQDPKTKVIRLA